MYSYQRSLFGIWVFFLKFLLIFFICLYFFLMFNSLKFIQKLTFCHLGFSSFNLFWFPFVVICMYTFCFCLVFIILLWFGFGYFIGFVECFFILRKFLYASPYFVLDSNLSYLFWIKVVCPLFQNLVVLFMCSFVVGNFINDVLFLYVFITLFTFCIIGWSFNNSDWNNFYGLRQVVYCYLLISGNSGGKLIV